MRFKMNLQLFSDETTMDFGDADTGTEVAEELTAEQGDDFLSGLDEADATGAERHGAEGKGIGDCQVHLNASMVVQML